MRGIPDLCSISVLKASLLGRCLFHFLICTVDSNGRLVHNQKRKIRRMPMRLKLLLRHLIRHSDVYHIVSILFNGGHRDVLPASVLVIIGALVQREVPHSKERKNQ